MGRAPLLLAVLVGLCSCGFSPAGLTGAIADGGGADGDALPATCTPGATACSGRGVETCGSDGTWSATQTCDFTCAGGACVVASNVGSATVASCGSDAPALDPGPTGTVTYNNSSGAALACSSGCGGGTLYPVAKLNNVAWFCVSSINLQANAQLVLSSSGVPGDALGLIVDGTATIDGRIALDGGDATSDPDASDLNGGDCGPPTPAGPGGFAGACQDDSDGRNGVGSGGGGGGHQQNCNGANWIGGGGGGGGNLQPGGSGGSGECQPNAQTAGGGGGGPAVASMDLLPLIGGAGGGGGGDATNNGGYGYAGGGGGGALQISARIGISIGGFISARGGDGYGVAGTIDGGGGGGAGGGVLLESPVVTIAGSMSVDGGAGGPSGGGSGGAGATGAEGPQPGTSYTNNGQGGGGGGGAGGIVMIRAIAPSCASGILSPIASCSTGALSAGP